MSGCEFYITPLEHPAVMLHGMRSSRDGGRKVSPPQPVYMSDDQKSEYLTSLRNSRPARPVGSRPIPTKAFSTPPPTKNFAPPGESSPAPDVRAQHLGSATTSPAIEGPSRCPSAASHHEYGSAAGVPSVRSRVSVGRPLAEAPDQEIHSICGRKTSSTPYAESMSRSSSGSYRESAATRVDRQEAVSLREALDEIDHRNEETRIHAAARDEAADLVWHHIHPKAPERDKHPAYPNPDILRASQNQSALNLQNKGGPRSCNPVSDVQRGTLTHSVSFNSSVLSSGASSTQQHAKPLPWPEKCSSAGDSQRDGDREPHAQPEIVVTDESTAQVNRGKSSGQRKGSSGSSRSGFPNAGDRIYEDSDSGSTPAERGGTFVPDITTPLRPTNRNSIRGARPLPLRAATADSRQGKPYDRFEIFKNPPSQSRGAGYTLNTPSPPVEVVPEVETPPSRDGVEIRGEDIRAATSMRRRDRSPKLPTPTAVTDCPERPIASFHPGWQPESASKEDGPESGRPGPRPITRQPIMAVSAPSVPTINIDDSESPNAPVPSIKISDDNSESAVTSNTNKSPSSMAKSRPAARPLPQPSSTMPGKLPTVKSTSRLSCLNPSAGSKMVTATCTSCGLPISGRIVTAAGAGAASLSLKARFHPECFACHHCSTALECVAFYPEPEDKRNQRVEAAGVADCNLEGELRFYCHLDFHELFSPRCRSCKTPIEGQVILAAGAQWHPGHFFCSECGDPFDSNTPFVEKDNYAYCVSCHTRRTSARCKACKRQILDETTVQALGGHWHAACFTCYECDGDFGDEGRFFVRDVVVEGTEKEKRRGIATRTEERAVCEGCEGRRLKA